jgi:hypothetical protein
VKTNLAVKSDPVYTHEGAKAIRIDPERQLRRSVMSCLLWEDTFYEDGVDIGKRIADLVPKCRAEYVAACAFEARTRMKLRHVPLLIVREMARHQGHKALVGRLLADVIQRPDEIAEFLSLYWLGGKKPLSKQVKTGLAAAFLKFDEYQFAKYDRDAKVRLRDALFLCHAKPDTEERATLFKKIVERKLTVPDTWEVALSGGADKRETFERLMAEKKLGALAFLRNLRNMKESGVARETVLAYAEGVKVERVLPFRFISAANAVPEWEPIIEPLMFKCLAAREKIPGSTVLLIDGSGSMESAVSAKSDISRRDAAIALAILLRELCEDVRIYGFSTMPWTIPPRRGFALREAVNARVIPEATMLGRAVRHAIAEGPADRIIVITDEQSQDVPPAPPKYGYVINVAAYKNGIGYGPWTHIDGWSEAVIDYIREVEA